MTHAENRFWQLVGDLTKVLIVIFAARALMLLGNVPIITIPILDEIIVTLWHALEGLFRSISNSPLLPRLGGIR